MTDLRRPGTKREAHRLTREYAGDEPDVLRRDFHNSLLAAFTPKEVACHLATAELSRLTAEPLGDRHFLVSGRVI